MDMRIKFCNTYPDVVPREIRAKREGCCTAYAWSVVFDKPFSVCREYLQRHGYTPAKGMTSEQVEKAFSSVRKYKFVKGSYSPNNRITINQFTKKHPKGRFFCMCRGHAFAIVDGVVYDHTQSPRRQIKYAWRVYLP